MKEDEITVNLMEVYSTLTTHSNLIIEQFIPFPFIFHTSILKAGFHMNADDRRQSRIADRRRSQRELFPYNRRRSQGRLQPYISFRGNVKCTRPLCQLQANLFLLLVLKRRQRQLQNRRKHRFWIRKIFMQREDKLNFSPIFPNCQPFGFCL